MASHRPGFARVDTDFNHGDVQLTDMNKNGESSSRQKNWHEEDGTEGKGFSTGVTDVSEGQTTAIYDVEAEDHFGSADVVSDAKDVTTHVLHVEDDPTLSPWTFRAFFTACGLAVFASVLQEIYYFKPQVIYVSVTFLTVVAYPIGEGLAWIIPRKGKVGRFLNPFPFNAKEHAAICVMASASAVAATSTEILAAQKLYYNETPQPGAAIFLVISSQLLGMGIAGLLRSVLTRPTNMLWPINLPINSLLETLHRDKKETKQRLKLFWIIFAVMFVWEIIPEWMFPLLQGVSIFCLANKHSMVFTNLFGGSQGNEGLGLGAVSFDWQYVAGLNSPLWVPLQTLTNSFTGYMLCTALFMAVYYGNIWESKSFPFLSQLLYDGRQSTYDNYVEYNVTAILTADNEIDSAALAANGIPYLTGTYVAYLITTNMGSTATIVHMFLWNFDDIKAGWTWASPANLRKALDPKNWRFWEQGETKEEWQVRVLADPAIDPHYKIMVRNGYDEVPNWWYGIVLVLSFFVGLGTIYAVGASLPWWGYIISNLIATVFILFFGAQYGITGFGFNQQPIVQMLAGYLHPGKPLANMYFTVFAYNGVIQGELLARDIKLAQYAHLSFKATFVFQMLGCILGSIFNYIMMQTIVTAQATILLSSEGSNIWSGQTVQQYNTLAIAWSMAGDMFSVGARYQWVTISYLVGFIVPLPFYFAYKYTKVEFFRYMNLSIILWYMGWLFVGVNSSILSYFALGFVAQWWLRKKHPAWFNKYNYVVSAALDGGTQVIVFILSFAVFGGSGAAVDFPNWAGNNGGITYNKNIDFCMFNPALES